MALAAPPDLVAVEFAHHALVEFPLVCLLMSPVQFTHCPQKVSATAKVCWETKELLRYNSGKSSDSDGTLTRGLVEGRKLPLFIQ